MKYQEQPVNNFLAHLKRHPVPELISDECMEALDSIQRQYGDVISHGAGLEVRLGNPERYVDYIMNIDDEKIPFLLENCQEEEIKIYLLLKNKRDYYGEGKFEFSI